MRKWDPLSHLSAAQGELLAWKTSPLSAWAEIPPLLEKKSLLDGGCVTLRGGSDQKNMGGGRLLGATIKNY